MTRFQIAKKKPLLSRYIIYIRQYLASFTIILPSTRVFSKLRTNIATAL